MVFKKILLIFFVLFLFTACSHKSANKQQSVFITMKTKSLKFADMGFIYVGDNELKIEVYATGQALLNLDINAENICLSLLECMDKKEFNQEVLSQYYPQTLLENLFRAKPIFNGMNLEKSEEGFTQKISEKGQYEISYSVVRGHRVFRDKINKILIKVREVQ